MSSKFIAKYCYKVQNCRKFCKIIIASKGTLIRTEVTAIRITSRNTQGVTLIKTQDKTVVSVAIKMSILLNVATASWSMLFCKLA